MASLMFIRILITMLFALALFSRPTEVIAGGTPEETCRPIYGGGTSCVQTGELSLDLTVNNPQTKKFVDNLGRTDTLFFPGEKITFEATITNVSKDTITDATAKILLPQYLDLVSGNGDYNKETKNLVIAIDKLDPDKSNKVTIETKVVAKDALPKNQNTVCVITQAIVIKGTKFSQDNSHVCLQKEIVTPTPSSPNKNDVQPEQKTKGGLPVFPTTETKTTPNTGTESFALMSLIPLAGAGYWLRRKV